jgi:hypothetical protein
MQLFRSYIGQVNDMEQREMDAINQGLPFKQEDAALDCE